VRPNTSVLWWHWLIAVGFVLVLCLFLKSYFLTPRYITPPAPPGSNLPDAQQNVRNEATQLQEELKKHRSE
jgi:hypothetical protein